jgi:hypothetical protein
MLWRKVMSEVGDVRNNGGKEDDQRRYCRQEKI